MPCPKVGRMPCCPIMLLLISNDPSSSLKGLWKRFAESSAHVIFFIFYWWLPSFLYSIVLAYGSTMIAVQ